MSSRFARAASGIAVGSDAAGDSPRAAAGTGVLRNLHADVLTRSAFLDTLKIEQRRADRSRAPLSLVVTRIATDGGLDRDDMREIVADLYLKKREIDIVGYLGKGVVAFLLPYSNASAAATFSKQIVAREGLIY